MRWHVALSLVAVCLPTILSAADSSFTKHVKPILESRCVACHGCYDAPCQLKLESGQGLLRGASTLPVYDGGRATAASPTRLFMDAHSESAWREKGFLSVLEGSSPDTSVLAQMLALGRSAQLPANSKIPEHIALGINRVNSCPSAEQFSGYQSKHPQEGMPLAVTGLSDKEFSTLEKWLARGAPVSPDAVVLTKTERAAMQRWERLLNFSDARHHLVGRWLYEHLYLAHLYFSDLPHRGHFFELVRSRTAPGDPIQVIATLRANDAPGGPFWYRLRPVLGTLVHKSHITFALNDAKLEKTEKLFFSDDWSAEHIPTFSADLRANPFVTFAAIPAQARYQFMLDDAEYFIRTFIRGPVCRGQIATDVIRDNFWVFFQDPKHDLFIADKKYRAQVEPLLGLPGQDDDLLALGPEWLSYRGKRNDYLSLRDTAYAHAEPEGPRLDTFWHGNGHNTNALLSVFRHHDNAAVRRGLIGEVPQTIWLMDFPLLERSYYHLAVNFDVFGNVSHQAQTRFYFDLIRNGSEQNFLRLLPSNTRKKILSGWYQGTGKLKLMLSYNSLDTEHPSAINYKTDKPLPELADMLLTELNAVNAVEDPINRCQVAPCARADQPEWAQHSDEVLATLSSRPASQLAMIKHLPELSLLTIHSKRGDDLLYSLARNRAHTNVAFLLGESLRYQPSLDTLTVYPGILGSYPNFAFGVQENELEAFVNQFEQGKTPQDFAQLVQRWGIRRTHPAFWQYLDSYHDWLRRNLPREAGILDINRYQNL